MDKITYQIRTERCARILNERMNSGMAETAWYRVKEISENQIGSELL